MLLGPSPGVIRRAQVGPLPPGVVDGIDTALFWDDLLVLDFEDLPEPEDEPRRELLLELGDLLPYDRPLRKPPLRKPLPAIFFSSDREYY